MREISAFCLKVIPVAWTMALVFSRPAIAQVLPTVNVVLAQQETTASETSEVQLSLEANSRLGGLTYVPGHWGEFQLRLENGGEEDRELLCTSYFDGLPGLQYGESFGCLQNPVPLASSPDSVSRSDSGGECPYSLPAG
ncbi:MAG: hypothetical protein R3B91_20695 [Planctomycetaceae bacterium]